MKPIKLSFMENLPLVTHTKLFGSAVPGGQHQGYTEITVKNISLF
jgi:hypothetical protein